MEGERYLFVGGPVDGHWILVPKNRWTWSVRILVDPDRKDKKYTFRPLLSCDPSEPCNDYVTYEEHRYHKEPFRNGRGKDYFIFRYYQIDDVLQHLIEGYVGVEADEELNFL